MRKIRILLWKLANEKSSGGQLTASYSQYSAEYGRYIVRTIVILNAGAIVALIGLVSSLKTQGQLTETVFSGFGFAIYAFIFGIVSGMAAAGCWAVQHYVDSQSGFQLALE